jgi:hypothetical protein
MLARPTEIVNQNVSHGLRSWIHDTIRLTPCCNGESKDPIHGRVF